MIELPKIERDPKLTEHHCKCRPVCKSRRRVWKGKLQKTSDELLLERKPLAPCQIRWPSVKVYPNGPCPLLGRVKGVTIRELNFVPDRPVVRICQAPLDPEGTVDTTYLRYAELSRKIGAWDAVRSRCNRPFCDCCACCACNTHDYTMKDAERKSRRRRDMRDFDARVKHDYQTMRIMYQ